jgi:hypothetical protein
MFRGGEKKETMESKAKISANDQTSFIIKKSNIRTERNGSCGIQKCMEEGKKEEKKQVGETERTRKKKAPHTTHKRMKIFFLKMIQRMDKNKNI